MNIVMNLDQYKQENVFFNEPIKNNVMNGGKFIRILYSSSIIILNGINLLTPFNTYIFEKHYNKMNCIINQTNNKIIFDNIKLIEEQLLSKININNKIPEYKIWQQLICGNIKFFIENININNNNNNCSFMLKISGIWETDVSYGLTYKFSIINHPLNKTLK